MSNDLTNFAAEGFDAYRDRGQAPIACPYINTSDASNAWHLGRELARWGESRPTPGMKPRESKDRIAITAGRGDTLNMRGYGDVLLRRFRRNGDNSFAEVR